ncbi:hypothetical protein HAP94_24850 [Acidithiobacillus ferrivorans]|nr:hypothetical protein [Acidithiobacillus ferrivorans]
MDITTVEQQYDQLQQEAQGVSQSLQSLATKLKAAADSGNTDAREWLLDLRELAVNIQQEQQTAMAVMQAVHQAAQNELQGQDGQWQPSFPQTPNAGFVPQQPQSGGFLNSLVHSGFGQAMMTGAGFGIGDDLINSIL